jgi:hypothetical protein
MTTHVFISFLFCFFFFALFYVNSLLFLQHKDPDKSDVEWDKASVPAKRQEWRNGCWKNSLLINSIASLVDSISPCRRKVHTLFFHQQQFAVCVLGRNLRSLLLVTFSIKMLINLIFCMAPQFESPTLIF